ncbi:uncharacterized protein C8A04DRAFT_10350 [Dichotomopilus funicola]|uniref:Uncharacterized protein n=1 Tax=Dichotomopilus funicola TaxID=1934379 RepID=A0AAN6V6J6_9PEZI|nr:hypothetical protein C8A04DRAFT_10350 [Dichotomopilus funicola]
MLLTSGQVSIAVSSGIIFLCTAALFLSGYALQQRTLRDLRQAIKPAPRPSPKIFLPDRFKQSTTELPDGTVIILDDGKSDSNSKSNDQTVIQVVKSPPAEDKQPTKTTTSGNGGKAESQAKLVGPLNKQDSVEKQDGNDGKLQDDAEEQKPMSRAERRRRIKEEIMKLSQGQERGYYQRRLW